MLATITSGAVIGIQGYRVEIEVQMGVGMVNFFTVGLPEGAVKEARIRVRSALIESGFDWPLRSITVNLAPADIRKDGSAFDLPMAIALLAADDRIPCHGGRVLPQAMVVGELGLSGEVRPVRGVLPLTVAARDAGLRSIFVPAANAAEAALVADMEVFAVENLAQFVAHLRGHAPMSTTLPRHATYQRAPGALDMADVKGQSHAKRACEVAAAGGHNLLLVGPPGSGKTMLARRLPTILPTMGFEEALEVTTVYSVAGILGHEGLVSQRPFRAPHHTISDVGLIGGGTPTPRPGEVSLAHHGVLFLDELPEFRRSALEVLRQPLEDQSVNITRRLITVEYPARVMLVASMNACPCGFLGSTRRACTCRHDLVERYRARISGPLLDRIDLQIEVSDISYRELRADTDPSESSDRIRDRVETARQRQRHRLASTGIHCNAQLRPQELAQTCRLDPKGHHILERVADRLAMSARACDRIVKVARTIADLAGSETICPAHIAEAVAFRCLDRYQITAAIAS